MQCPRGHGLDLCSIDECLLVGALPDDARIIHDLAGKEDVTGVVNACAEFNGLTDVYNELGISHLRVPVSDFTTPTLSDLVTATTWIHRHVYNARLTNPHASVYVHCKAGKGRSVALALAYLISKYELTPLEAQAILLEKRPQVDVDVYESDPITTFYSWVLDNGQKRIPFV
ncbi:protein-tyrosine phosphatase-like protein [Entophlyctis helioformis]|nr:protein-tyrosine phosphatase-like protein [Entophlyctis helioformis]